MSLFFIKYEGTRMWRRGADPEGYAANFVESEQILQTEGFTASYVLAQLYRGIRVWGGQPQGAASP
jgi:hypothetical protein